MKLLNGMKYEKKMETYPLSSEKMGRDFFYYFLNSSAKKYHLLKKEKRQ